MKNAITVVLYVIVLIFYVGYDTCEQNPTILQIFYTMNLAKGINISAAISINGDWSIKMKWFGVKFNNWVCRGDFNHPVSLRKGAICKWPHAPLTRDYAWNHNRCSKESWSDKSMQPCGQLWRASCILSTFSCDLARLNLLIAFRSARLHKHHIFSRPLQADRSIINYTESIESMKSCSFQRCETHAVNFLNN